MGVDAEIFAQPANEMSDKEILSLACDLWGCFPRDVMVWRESSCGGPHHCITVLDEEGRRAGGFTGRPQIIEVHLSGRYYGINYERGNLPAYLSIARFLRDRIPGCLVWYGGDSSTPSLLTASYEGELWDHYIKHNTRPYHGYFDRNDPAGRPEKCSLCKLDYIKFGWGGDGGYGAFSCPGCGHSIQTGDGGKTWAEYKSR